MVVSNIFYFYPYLGKIPILTNIFQRGWNHQLENQRWWWVTCPTHSLLLTQNWLEDLPWGLMAWWFPPAFVRTETQHILWGLHLEFCFISDPNKKTTACLRRLHHIEVCHPDIRNINMICTFQNCFYCCCCGIWLSVSAEKLLIGLVQLCAEDWYEQNKDCGSWDFLLIETWTNHSKFRQEQFTPPVCNKLMHKGQLSIMLLGTSYCHGKDAKKPNISLKTREGHEYL